MIEHGPFAHTARALESQAAPSELSGSSGGLPNLFQFSQNSLQDYADCPRRFQLHYVEGQRWPAAQSEPIEEYERFVAHGVIFHLQAQRYLKGIPVDRSTVSEPPLSGWWEAFIQMPPRNLPTAIRLVETQLSVPVGEHRLMAKFDLLAIDPGKRIVIVDWKTSRRRTPGHELARRLQTKVYPYVLVEAGAQLFGGPVLPEQVTLIYWFANAPLDPEIFAYNTEQHADARAYLQGMVDEILGQESEVIWPLTDSERLCQYCVYRSLCGRGVRAGLIEEADAGSIQEDFDFDLDLEMIDEIAF